jgi:predicted transcriptional regulator
MSSGSNKGRNRTFMNSDVLSAMDSLEDPFVTTTEIADELDVESQTVLQRMHELHDEGQIKRKDVGANAVVWWRE